MTRRAVALLLTGPPATAARPAGTDPAAFAGAMAEDVADLLADLASVEPVVVASPARAAEARTLVASPDHVLVPPADRGLPGAWAALERRGFDVAAVVAPDVPDLPGLVLAKTLSAMRSRPVAVAPAGGGGLVVLTCRLPAPGWLVATGVGLDTPDAVGRLRAATPRRTDLECTPGWHRLRHPGDVERLDPGLEGWEATRRVLAADA
ncbi:MAG TPA: hypothetical protein VFX70_21145 [Mycobacteriales bacterium]|nr:hypothetical protein [Mycobacteriales bacterium]